MPTFMPHTEGTKRTGPEKISVQVVITRVQQQRLKQEAIERGISFSELLRYIIATYHDR